MEQHIGRHLLPDVSIRASAREATAANITNAVTGDIEFQSAPPHGRRHVPPVYSTMRQWLFQSAPPHGRRPAARSRAISTWPKFQSAPPHGRRQLYQARLANHGIVSIRASAREATHVDVVLAVLAKVSIRASAREATHVDVVLAVLAKVSIRASAREATRCCARSAVRSQCCFNPRLRTGGDLPRPDEDKDE